MFEEKYKEHQPEKHPETVAKVLAAGKTPAGQHLPIMLNEIIAALAPQPGERAVDCTLGYGGHATAILRAISPEGRLLALDQDPLEIIRAEARLRATGCSAEAVSVRRMNFAGIRRALDEELWSDGADIILADLGVSSMQFDNPARGFSFKFDGPLDMRMNPQRGLSARDWLRKANPAELTTVLTENADEPRAAILGEALAGKDVVTTRALADAIRSALPLRTETEEREASVRRVFQALRIAVNDEFSALDTFLRQLPDCLRPGGRVAILSFHSGEDRRAKNAFREGHRAGHYRAISEDITRASLAELRDNPRASSAKLRWAVR